MASPAFGRQFWGIGVISGAMFAFNFDGGPVGLWLGLLVGLTRCGALAWLAHAPVYPADKFWRFDFNGVK